MDAEGEFSDERERDPSGRQPSEPPESTRNPDRTDEPGATAPSQLGMNGDATPPLAEGPADEDGLVEAEPGLAGLGTHELFLRVNSVIPDAQDLVTIEPGRSCAEALAIMAQHDFSQLPIVIGEQVIGLFSYRSFALAVTEHTTGKPGDIAVEEAMEHPVWVRASDELGPLMDVFDARDVVLVGDEDDLQAVVTGMDVLRRLDALAEPFIRLRGIELALRQLVDAAADAGTVAQLAQAALAAEYANRSDQPPDKTEDMTLGQLVQVVLYGPSWMHMKTTLGANRNNAVTHLSGLSGLRNDALHFRRDLDEDDLARIKTTSDWLRTRMRAAGLAEGSR